MKLTIKKSFWLKIFIISGVIFAGTIGVVYKFKSASDTIYDFDYDRDAKSILKMFDQDWYWLVFSSKQEYDPDFTLRYRTQDKNPENFGKLIIKVLREKDKLAGFTAYFKKNFFEGYILYVGVDRAFRGKGYGEILVRYALKEMFSFGCNVVRLVTRPVNKKARSLYEKVGFELEKMDENFAYYVKYK